MSKLAKKMPETGSISLIIKILKQENLHRAEISIDHIYNRLRKV
jgi:hypothetical protein